MISGARKPTTTLARRRESDEEYSGVVLALTDRLRIIECRDGIQWIIQRRVSADGATTAQWRGQSYHRSRESLLAVLVSLKIDLSADQRKVLDGLPAWAGQYSVLPARLVR